MADEKLSENPYYCVFLTIKLDVDSISICTLYILIDLINFKHRPLCHGLFIDIKKVNKQLTHKMHVKDRYVNGTFMDKLTKWYQ